MPQISVVALDVCGDGGREDMFPKQLSCASQASTLSQLRGDGNAAKRRLEWPVESICRPLPCASEMDSSRQRCLLETLLLGRDGGGIAEGTTRAFARGHDGWREVEGDG